MPEIDHAEYHRLAAENIDGILKTIDALKEKLRPHMKASFESTFPREKLVDILTPVAATKCMKEGDNPEVLDPFALQWATDHQKKGRICGVISYFMIDLERSEIEEIKELVRKHGRIIGWREAAELD